jgi:competence protein ComEA
MGRWRGRFGWRWLAGLGGIGVLAGAAFLGWRITAPSSAETVAAEAIAAQVGTPPQAAAEAKMLTVYVSGAVERPGVYRLAAGLRVGDALAAAGGILPDADAERLPNVAARLTDGKQVKVPRKGSSGPASKLDINIATEAELDLVPGIPPGLAHEIVAYRQSYGPFASLTDLRSVLGLDAATLTPLRKYLTAG